MGIANMPLSIGKGLSAITSIDAKLFGQMFLALPEGSKIVDIVTDVRNPYTKCVIKVENKLFKDGVEIVANFTRDVAVVDGVPISVDQFRGLDLEGVLINETER